MPETIGFVDGLEGAYVRGWALTEGSRPAAIVIRDASGKPLARGSAEQERPDVGRLAYGRTACGFRIPVRRLRLAGALRVFADGVELAGSPVPVGPGRYDGELSVSGSVATGWVNERTEGFRGARIQLRDQDGALLGETEAAASREDPDPFYAPARFTLALAPTCFGRPDLIVRAFVNGVRFAEAQCAMRVDGYLDALSPSRCGGWLLSPDAPGRTLEIEVFRGGVLVGKGACNLPRQDVRDRYPQAWRVGFEIRLDPAQAAAGARQTYSVRLAGTDVELFDGPFMVQDRSEAIEAARRMGRLARVGNDVAPADSTVLRRALSEFIARQRQTDERVRVRVPSSAAASGLPDGGRRLTIVIPIYRDVEVTRACVESVLATRDPGRDAVVLVNDSSPDEGMAALLERFAGEPEVYLLTNPENRGFIRTVNRGLALRRRGDILLLNSDTRVFPGLFEELCRVAHSAPDVGTVTALSNNATIFSYPHPALPNADLADVEWAEVASAAREANGGVAMDVPTGHGFCMLIRREVLDLAGGFDESFGRGYGEENDFCQRIADLGFRNVVAAGAFVEHRDSISFGAEKKALMEVNLARLRRMYPDYTPAIMEFEHGEGLRRARWPLDSARLRKASAAGASFALVVTNWLGGGARKAIADIEAAVGYGEARKLTLSCRADGMIELEAGSPALRAVFAADETEALFRVLSAARVTHVLTHQVLGYPPAFLTGLAAWARGRHAIYYVHDFYPICPRVTMIDAAGSFCAIAAPDTCRRCIAGAGAHEASRLDALAPAEHRAAFGELLGAFRHVVAPSEAAASYLRRVWPDLQVSVIPHPEPALVFPASSRDVASREVVLLGGIGPHKGSAKLLEIARRARLSHPDLCFRVIGHTNIDAELRALGNVFITGSYEPWEQAALVAQAEGGVALFLHNWPETYSFTLSEAAAHGLFPLVPDIGAPAERVRAAHFGAVFGFPIEATEVLRAIETAFRGQPARSRSRGPAGFARPDAVTTHRALMKLEAPAAAGPARRAGRAQAAGGRMRASA